MTWDIGVGYTVAADNLQVGRTVIADSVNPLPGTRDAWLEAANRTQVRSVEIEIICCDGNDHRRRVDTRTADISG